MRREAVETAAKSEDRGLSHRVPSTTYSRGFTVHYRIITVLVNDREIRPAESMRVVS
jgi:hypothetical protein